MIKYVGLLRGVNVGGKHKVSMSDLKIILQNLDCHNVSTILNTGNVIFDSESKKIDELSKVIESRISAVFGFPIPLILCKAASIVNLIEKDPYQDITVTKKTLFYISFLKKNIKSPITIPWASEDKNFKILDYTDKMIISVLDLAKSGTPKAMEIIEASFGKEITTRNWNTILKIGNKCQ